MPHHPAFAAARLQGVEHALHGFAPGVELVITRYFFNGFIGQFFKYHKIAQVIQQEGFVKESFYKHFGFRLGGVVALFAVDGAPGHIAA